MKRDNIHFTFRTVDGYKKPFVFVISAREAGKSTAFWLDKAYKKWKDNRQTTLVIKRTIVGITSAYIDSIGYIIKKFNPSDEVELHYKKGDIKDGVILVTLNGEPFIAVVALSASIDRIKSLILPNIGCMVFDEFINNKKFGEKYLNDEVTRFKEVYNTFYRETEEMMTCYFLGNPYSKYNPYFLHFGVDVTKLKQGAIVSGPNWVVQCYDLSQELRDYILSRNPLYQFDDSYTQYAFNGQSVNDAHIKISMTLPRCFKLQFVVRMQGKYIGFFLNSNVTNNSDIWHCRFLDEVKRDFICFDFNELVDGGAMVSRTDFWQFVSFKAAMQRRLVSFSDVNVYNLAEAIYYYL